MIRILILFLGFSFVFQCPVSYSQKPLPAKSKAKIEIYYFHPNERCPIDQSIEETTRKMMRTDFAKELNDGTIKFQVLNTEDKANVKIVEKFEMNAQALYLVTFADGKEKKNDLTEFAFSTCQSNPGKFKAEFKMEILKALK